MLADLPNADAKESSKGALAKEKMLRAALDVFGEYGFEGATTRMLATRAGMNLGAIPYYFGSKEDLYAEAASYLADLIEAKQSPHLQNLKETTSNAIEAGEICDAVVDFMIKQAHGFLCETMPLAWMHFFLSAQRRTGPAFEHLNQRVIRPAQAVVTPLIARILGRQEDAPETLALTFLGIHQALCIRLADAMLMNRMHWNDLSNERMVSLLEIVRTAIKVQLMHYPSSPPHESMG